MTPEERIEAVRRAIDGADVRTQQGALDLLRHDPSRHQGTPMTAWRLIETAPRDGSNVLVWALWQAWPHADPDPDSADVYRACWDEGCEAWVINGFTSYGEGFLAATHWMPIPEPPQ